jgi:hypothetical protein
MLRSRPLKSDSLAYYRAYVLDEDGRIRRAIELDCADDATALEEARQYADGHDVELWQLRDGSA